MATAHAPFRSLPDDVLQRLLVGLPLEDHRAAASVCKAFRDVINGPRFLALRKRYGFAEHSIVIVASVEIDGQANDISRIRVSHKTGGTASILDRRVISSKSTTDRGSRLFVSTEQPGATPSQILAVDVSSRRWRPFATLPRNQHLHCIEWHGGLLYVAGGTEGGLHGGQSDSLHAFNEATGLWDNSLPPMPHPCMAAASGIIGNELFIAGGLGVGNEYLSTLQIYDFTTRMWRLGVPLPHSTRCASGVVTDGKLYLVESKYSVFQSMMVYDVQSNTWTEQQGPPYQDLPSQCINAFAHNGRIVTVNANGVAFQRGSGSDHWSPFDFDLPEKTYGAAGSIVFG